MPFIKNIFTKVQNQFADATFSNSPQLDIPSNEFFSTDDKKTTLTASGLFQCTAVGIVSGEKRSVLHIYNSDLANRMQECGQEYKSNNPRGGDIIRAVISDLKSTPETERNKLKVSIVVGNFSKGNDAFLEQRYSGEQPIKELIDLVGPDNVKINKGLSLSILPNGKFS